MQMQRTPGYMRDIDIGANGRIFGIGARDSLRRNGPVYRWSAENWQTFSGAGQKITVDRHGNPWIIDDTNRILHYAGSGRWNQIPGTAIDIDAGANGDVYILGTDNPAPGNGSVYRWNGTAWTFIGGYGCRIAVDSRGDVWIVNTSRQIWRRRGSSWSQVPGSATAIAAGADGSVWIVGVGGAPAGNGRLYRWNGTRWDDMGGWGHTITVTPNGEPAIINSHDQIWSTFSRRVAPENLGRGSRKVSGRTVEGTFPLLVVLVEYQDVRFRRPDVKQYLDGLLFTDLVKSLGTFYGLNSAGKLQLGRAGIIGPVRHPMTFECAHRHETCPNRQGNDFRAAYLEALRLPEVRRFNFAAYDRNRNGIITNDELIVMFCTALPGPGGGGIARTLPEGGRVDNSLRVPDLLPLIDEETGILTIAHELAHSLGGDDLYGAGGRNNTLMTVMGSTVHGPNVHEYVNFDPWHKLRWGWVTPRMVLGSRGGKTERLTLAAPGIRPGGDSEPVLLWTRVADINGRIEYFLLEYRHRAPGGQPLADGHLASNGVVIWHILQNANHSLGISRRTVIAGDNRVLETSVQPGSDDVASWIIEPGPDRILQTRPRPGSDDVYGDDATAWVVAPPDHKLGGSRAWTPADGVAALRYLNNEPTHANVRVVSIAANNSRAEVEISFDA